MQVPDRRRSSTGAMIVFGGLSLMTCAAPPEPLRTFESAALGLTFSYPAGFQVGRYKQVDLPQIAKDAGMEPPFKNTVVLVEQGQLGQYAVDAIPVGEVPTISIDRKIGTRARILHDFCKDEYKVTLGKRLAYRLPGAPGPYGDQAYYYLVPGPDGALVAIDAHRFYLRNQVKTASGGLQDTHYDRVIEVIIKSLKMRGE